MLKRLKGKFVFVTMAFVLVMLAVIFSLVYHFTKVDLENDSYGTLMQVAQSAKDPENLREPLSGINSDYFVVYVDTVGQMLSAGYTHHDITDGNFLRKVCQKVLDKGSTAGVLEDYQLMYNWEQIRGVGILSCVDISNAQQTLTNLIHSCLFIGIASLVAFFALAVLLARWMIRPVEKDWQQQKEFVSDVSHELKTPLAVAMSNAELLQNEENTPQEQRQFAQNILAVSRQMRSLVEGMLELARADNGQIKKCFSNLDMSVLVDEALLPFEPVFFEKGMEIQSQIQPNIHVNGSTQHLRQVVEILLDNAQKYGEPGIVRVTLSRQGRKCLLAVSNPGQPIAQRELKQIFNRFYRVDKARNERGSFGLGLSIAKSMIEEHDGKIWAVSNPTGNCFCVELPCQ